MVKFELGTPLTLFYELLSWSTAFFFFFFWGGGGGGRWFFLIVLYMSYGALHDLVSTLNLWIISSKHFFTVIES
jgi:hypothetical protein